MRKQNSHSTSTRTDGEHGRIGLFSGKDFQLISLYIIPTFSPSNRHSSKYDTSTAEPSCRSSRGTTSDASSPTVPLRTPRLPRTSHRRRLTDINSNNSRIVDVILVRRRGAKSSWWMDREFVVYVSHRRRHRRASALSRRGGSKGRVVETLVFCTI